MTTVLLRPTFRFGRTSLLGMPAQTTVVAAPVPPGPPPPAAPDPMDARIARLQQLAELWRQGVLTDAELAAAKALVLAD